MCELYIPYNISFSYLKEPENSEEKLGLWVAGSNNILDIIHSSLHRHNGLSKYIIHRIINDI